MSASLVAALLALSAAVAWGSGDFTSGLATRRVGAFYTLLISFAVGLIGVVALVAITSESLPAPIDLIWGATASLLGTTGFVFMLRGFAIGRMSIVAPVSAVLAAAIPVLITAFFEGLPGYVQLLGFALAFVSIWLLSQREQDEDRPAGIGLALLAGLGFGLFFVALDQISEGAVFWPLVAGRTAACTVLVIFALVTGRKLIPTAAPWGLLVLAGVLDVGGNFFFLTAVQTGRLDIAAVLVSLYPAVTVLLAMVIAKERMTRVQAISVALAVVAIALITI